MTFGRTRNLCCKQLSTCGVVAFFPREFATGMVRRHQRDPIFSRILLNLPQDICHHVLRKCKHVHLAPGEPIYWTGGALEHVYFINSGLISLIKSMREGGSVGIGAVGTEGVVSLFA